ncbi:MAG: hypothetical protein LBJ12_07170 [Oscillospiraceae bacterium]|nr:hypothetical protein [Oscillospiraceae bacterium]
MKKQVFDVLKVPVVLFMCDVESSKPGKQFESLDVIIKVKADPFGDVAMDARNEQFEPVTGNWKLQNTYSGIILIVVLIFFALPLSYRLKKRLPELIIKEKKMVQYMCYILLALSMLIPIIGLTSNYTGRDIKVDIYAISRWPAFCLALASLVPELLMCGNPVPLPDTEKDGAT